MHTVPHSTHGPWALQLSTPPELAHHSPSRPCHARTRRPTRHLPKARIITPESRGDLITHPPRAHGALGEAPSASVRHPPDGNAFSEDANPGRPLPSGFLKIGGQGLHNTAQAGPERPSPRPDPPHTKLPQRALAASPQSARYADLARLPTRITLRLPLLACASPAHGPAPPFAASCSPHPSPHLVRALQLSYGPH